MNRTQRAALTAAVLLMANAASACQLVLTEYRSGRLLMSVPLDPQQPTATVSFTHSVLGTPVADRYEWRGRQAHLVEELFQGDGYGLPNAAGPGETMVREGDGWRLSLDRIVDPLVVPPVQGMRVDISGRPTVLLRTLSTRSIELQARDCATH